MKLRDVRNAALIGLIGLLALTLGPSASGQEPFLDGFEDGSLDRWSLWIGSDSLATSRAHDGIYSAWLLHPNDDIPGIILRNEFAADGGIFEAWFWIGNCYECNGMIAFQASDSTENYSLTCVPLELDGWSTILLSRAVSDHDSVITYVHSPNLIPSQEWFKVSVHRYTDGPIHVFTTIRGVETWQMSADDNRITGAKPFAVGGWGGIFIDEIRYDALCCRGYVGDVNGDGAEEPSIGDIAMMIDAKFISGTCSQIACMAEADANHSGGAEPACDDISIGDVSTLIDYLYITGPSLGLPDCW